MARCFANCSHALPICVLFFFNAQGDVMAARVDRDPAGGSETLPDGSVHEGRGTVQLHDVTGKVQRARLIIAVQSATSEFPRWRCAFKI